MMICPDKTVILALFATNRKELVDKSGGRQ